MARTPTERVLCRTPTPGKKPTRISRQAFEAIRREILKALPKSGPGRAFRELTAAVDEGLAAAERALIGSTAWYVTTVKLELECRGEIERVPGAGPQRLRRLVARR